MMKFNILYCILVLACLSGCNQGLYQRDKNCHLDGIHLKGNVKRVETICLTTIPITEVINDCWDSRKVVSGTEGNITIDFDNLGNVSEYKGYGVDGKLLFDIANNKYGYDCWSALPMVPGDRELPFNRIQQDSLENGKSQIFFYRDETPVLKIFVDSDSDGFPVRVIKDYCSFSLSDTLYMEYSKYDTTGNWTEARARYVGVLRNAFYSYTLKRQITYWGESPKARLIDSLDELMPQDYEVSNKNKTISKKYFSLSLPDYFGDEPNEFFDYGYKVRDPNTYAFVGVNVRNPTGFYTMEDMIYDKEVDDFCEESMRESLAQGNIHLLKWLPYKFVKIDGMDCMLMRYYRYGAGQPIPVYCEQYTVPANGYTFSIILSCQSRDYNKYYMDFQNIVKSIKLK